MPYLEELLKEAKEKKARAPSAEEAQAPVRVQPAAQQRAGEEKKILVDSYGDVRVYKQVGEPLLLYEIPTPHYRGGEKQLITALIDIAIGVIPPETMLGFTPEEARKKYLQRVLEIIDSTPELNVPTHLKQFYAEAVVREMVGYGMIDPLVQDDRLEEIMIVGQNKPVYVFHRKYDMMKTNVLFYEEKDIVDLIDRIARTIGRRIDVQSPLMDARLKDGTRVNATLPPATIDGPTLTLRKFRHDPLSVVDLINFKTMNYEIASFLWMAVDGLGALPANILIAGGTASGKTSTLNVLCSFVPNSERILTIEETAELNLPLEHWIRCEARPPSPEGTGEIDMNTLLKNALRMRPDRVIVGEIRGAEGYTLFSAMNIGHRGAMGTVHANSAQETLIRLSNPPISVPDVMLAPLNFVLMQNRIHDRRLGTIRRVTELAEVTGLENGKPAVQILYSWDPVKDDFFATGVKSVFWHNLKKYTGLNEEDLEKERVEREKILRDLNARGVTAQVDVCETTQNYVTKKRLSGA
ncbi:CpaF family protein [Candidatus Micrarchaeota archaeon]|nr:CpaF family protein [Candidatus Micrarchaeota archaeon]